MPKPISALRSASRSHLAVKPTRDHVWISDDFLSQTFKSFVRNHKRHGSNVPGPLEARRRAAKRRATYLAHSSTGNYNLDSFALFDTRQQQGWWQKESALPWQDTSSCYWPFELPLFSAEPPPPPTPMLQNFEHNRIGHETMRPEVRVAEADLQDHLKDVGTHEALVEMLPTLLINLRHTPQLARVILQQILSLGWHHDEIAQYLLDPRTNPPGTSNHMFVLENSGKHADLVTWLLREDVFSKAAHLGLLDATEIQQIFLAAPNIDNSVFPTDMNWASFCVQIINAMEASQVLRLSDLGVSFVQRWLSSIAQHDFTPAVPELLWRLLKCIGSSDEQAIESTVHTSLSMCRASTICYLYALVKLLLSQSNERLAFVVFDLTYQMVEEAGSVESVTTTNTYQDVDFEFRIKILEEVSRFTNTHMKSIDKIDDRKTETWSPFGRHEMMRNKRDTATDLPGSAHFDRQLQQRLAQASKLELWYGVLAELGFWDTSASEIYMDSFRDFVHRNDRDESRRRAIVGFWVLMVLNIQKNTNFNTYAPMVVPELKRSFLASESEGETLAIVHRVLASSPLPAKNKLFRRLSDYSQGYLNVKQNFWDLGRHLANLDDAQIQHLCDEKTYRSVKHHFPTTLTRVAESFNDDLGKFEELCINIIRNSNEHIKVVYRLLWHNVELRWALWKAGLLMQTGPMRWDNNRAGSEPALGGYSYLKIVDMMHNFAQALAESEQTTPRTAWRRILVLRRFLRICGAPIKAPFGRALWHAAVTREQENGREACYTAMAYFYSLTVQMEGEASAKRLLRAAEKFASRDPYCHGKSDEIVSRKSYPTETVWAQERNDGIESWKPSELLRTLPGRKESTLHQFVSGAKVETKVNRPASIQANEALPANTKAKKRRKVKDEERKKGRR